MKPPLGWLRRNNDEKNSIEGKRPVNNESPGLNWSYRDLFISLSYVFMALAILALVSNINKTSGLNAGPLMVTIHWDNKSNSDIDLWVKAPDNAPVGFSHPNDILCDHLRDDLGAAHDPQSTNSEITVCRKAASGEWIVDVMSYSVWDGQLPIWVDVTVQEMKGGYLKTLLYKRVFLTANGQELTVWRFSLDSHGDIIPGSISDLPYPMGPEANQYGHGS
jgi:hypothetical protein